jgi:predicted tellurium resistance membrane protein TerC
MIEEITIFFQIVLIDLVLAGDNAIVIGVVASQFDHHLRKKNYILGNWSGYCFKNHLHSCNSIFTSNRWT